MDTILINVFDFHQTIRETDILQFWKMTKYKNWLEKGNGERKNWTNL